jgi:ABC-type transport system involved in cytochrome bd biosynthesis fused ATPase/permease subunit
MGILVSILKSRGKLRMKRIAVLMLVVVLSGWPILAEAQGVSIPDDPRQSQKAAKKEQRAIEKYNKAQQKAQQKAQRKADKNQQKAAKKYDKEQRKLLKNANLPAKRAS